MKRIVRTVWLVAMWLGMTSISFAALVGALEGELKVQSGTAVYQLPVTVPKGKNGLNPSLSITYKQGSSNGVMGLGFHLSGLSVISRCAATKEIDGISGGIDFSSHDHFCLDGERMIDIGGGVYRLYHDKTTRIVRSGSSANPTSWEVWKSNGYIYKYGTKSESQLQTPRGTLSWWVASVKDRFGNTITYTYRQKNNTILPREIRYQQYKVTFDYGGRNDKATDYFFGRRRVHDVLLKAINVYTNDALFYTYNLSYSRINPSVSDQRYSKLQKITYCDRNHECLKPIVFDYKKDDTYDNTDKISKRTEIEDLISSDTIKNYIISDMNNDGYNDVCYYDGRLKCAMNRGKGSFDSADTWTDALNVDASEWKKIYDKGVLNDDRKEQVKKLKKKQMDISASLTLLDINHDGFTDYCAATEEGITCGLNDQGRRFVDDKKITTAFTIKDDYRFMDIDRDNDIDVCAFNDGKLMCLMNEGMTFETEKDIDYAGSHHGFDDNRTYRYEEAAILEDGEEPKIKTSGAPMPKPSMLDINGDGYMDICGFQDSSTNMYCALGTGFDHDNKVPTFGKFAIWGKHFPIGNNSIVYKASEEKRRGQEENTTRSFTRTFRFADLNNDGLQDVCYRHNNILLYRKVMTPLLPIPVPGSFGDYYECRINTGEKFLPPSRRIKLASKDWTYGKKEFETDDSDPLYQDMDGDGNEMDMSWVISMQENSIELKDKDGDGRVDFSAMIGHTLYVAHGTGSGFGRLQRVSDIDPHQDVTDEQKTVYINALKKFFNLKTVMDVVVALDGYGPVKQISDIDGKNNAEVCYRSMTGLSCIVINNSPLALLGSVTSSHGLKTEIAYGRVVSAGHYISSDDAVLPMVDRPADAFMVTSVTTDNAIGGTNSLRFDYGGYKVDLSEGRSGFASITQTDQAKNTRTVTEYYRDATPLSGKPKETRNYVGDRLISRTLYTYETIKENHPKYQSVRLKTKTTYVYTESGDTFSTTVEEYPAYDAYGYPTKTVKTITDTTGLDYTVTTETEYLHDTSDWLLGKPTMITVTHKRGGHEITKHTQMEYGDHGELIRQVLEPDSAEELTTEYIWNSDRTELTTRISDREGNTRESFTQMDAYGRVILARNPLGQTRTVTYDSMCSLPSVTTDIAGRKTRFAYDSQCRQVRQILPDGKTITTRYDWSDGIDLGVDYQEIGYADRDNSVYMVTVSSSTGEWSRKYYDALGRVIRTMTLGSGGVKVITDTVYDERGQIKAKTAPYFAGKFSQYMTDYVRYYRDDMGRVTKQVQPSKRGDIVTTIEYDGGRMTVHSPGDHTKITEKNALDQTIKITQNDGSVIRYDYDPMGKLIRTDANGKTIKIEYDKFGRKTQMNDPSLGKWKYYYNAFGEMVNVTAPDKNITVIKYDKLGRVTEKVLNGTTTKFVYDTAKNGIGKIASSTNGIVTKTYEYDTNGQTIATHQAIDDKEFDTYYAYDANNRLKEITYPSGLHQHYEYEPNGMLKSISLPKKDLWDYDYLQLEKALKATYKYIIKLEQRVSKLEDKIMALHKKAEEYRSDARYWAKKENTYASEISRLYRARRQIQAYTNKVSRKAYELRRKARYYRSKFKGLVLRFVRSAGGGYYYKNTDCTHHNWKGHCTRRNNAHITIPKWMVQGRDRYCVKKSKHRSTCKRGPARTIVVSKLYYDMADKYDKEKKSQESRVAAKNREINSKKSSKRYAAKQKARYIKLAKGMAQDARKQADQLRDILKELNNQKAAKEKLEEALKKRMQDPKEVFIWSATTRDAQGRINGELYGNGYLTTRYYDPSGTIDRVKTGMGETLIRDIRYGYDARNNIISKSDPLHGVMETYGYDDLDRITSWSYTNSRTRKTYDRTYTYDDAGNLIFKTGIGDMTYDEHNRLKSAGSDESFRYDANGNMLEGNGKRYTYTAFNKVARIDYAGGYQERMYDEADELVKQEFRDGRVIYHVGKGYELIEEKLFGGRIKRTMRHHIFAEDKVIAVHEKTIIDDQKQADKTAYIHRDILGSVDTVTDAHGKVVLRNEYTPYGERIPNDEGNHLFDSRHLRGYTGHRQIPEANLVDMNARIYDPVIGRFTSPDTMIPHPDRIQAYNRYVYVYGNPIKYNDPSGHFIGFLIGAAIFTIAATSDDPVIHKFGMLLGQLMMMGADMGMSAMAQGATVGFTTSFIASGGDMGQAILGALTTATSTGMSFGIGETFGHGFSLEGAFAHGTVQGMIAVMRGGKFQNGFINGFLGKISGSLTKSLFAGASPEAMTFGGGAIATIMGGVAAEATGGDFAEGALTAMVVFLYNEIGDYRLRQAKGSSYAPSDRMTDAQKLRRLQGKEPKRTKIRAMEVLNGCVKEHYFGYAVSGAAGGGLVYAGMPNIAKARAAGAMQSSRGTSYASKIGRSISNVKMPPDLKMPRSIWHFVTQQSSYVGLKTVGSTIGRVTPVIGEIILYYDTLNIGACCVSSY